MPEIYIALQTTGNLIIDFGNIPENCKEEFDAEGLIASAIFAVYLNGEHFGFVCFDDCVVERKWDEDTVRFLKNISNLISTVVARQYAAEQLAASQRTIERMAFTDHLTGLSNRLSCDIELQAAIETAMHEGSEGYLFFIDIDDFKIVNDCYGHDYGDAILVSFAKWLDSTFRPPNQVFRFGGDEFVVVINPPQTYAIGEIAEQMKERAVHPWKAIDKDFYCTLSMGVVRFPFEGADSKTVIKQADIAMYEAKKHGKNNYKIYEERLGSNSLQRSKWNRCSAGLWRTDTRASI
jgi:diguanylate cyclase (GGDEF)-like protein